MSTPLVATGAVAASSCLYVATIGADKRGRMRLIKSRSGEVRLTGREQVSLKTFASFLLDFLKVRGIEHVTFVSSQENGSHMAMASSYRIQTVLLLMPIKVSLFSSSGLANRRLPPGAHLPGPDHERLGRQDAKMQARAIEAAVHWIADQAKRRKEARNAIDHSEDAQGKAVAAARADFEREAQEDAQWRAQVAASKREKRKPGITKSDVPKPQRNTRGGEDFSKMPDDERLAALVESLSA